MSNLTFYERQIIENGVHCGLKVKLIAKFVGRNHSVVSREIRRNAGDYFPYNARSAQEMADCRAKKTNKRKLDKSRVLYEYVCSRLKDGWSPQQIAGRSKSKSPPSELKGATISYEQIYEYIYNDGRDPNGKPLFCYLRRHKPNRQPRCSRQRRKVNIPNRISIHKRSEEINIRSRYGDWESDTMICKWRKGLSVQYERKSQLTRLNKLLDLKSETTIEAISKSVDTLPLYLFKSITLDNGPEGAKHQELQENFDIETYFCDPYKSWQKGGVENMNGLIRQYLPKNTNLKEIPDEVIYQIQERLNNRPRKSLNYLTPNEIMNMQIGALNS